jgi:hypothetical protein
VGTPGLKVGRGNWFGFFTHLLDAEPQLVTVDPRLSQRPYLGHVHLVDTRQGVERGIAIEVVRDHSITVFVVVMEQAIGIGTDRVLVAEADQNLVLGVII